MRRKPAVFNQEQAEMIGKALRETFSKHRNEKLTASHALRVALVTLLPYTDSMALLTAAGARLEASPDGEDVQLILDAVDYPYTQERAEPIASGSLGD